MLFLRAPALMAYILAAFVWEVMGAVEASPYYFGKDPSKTTGALCPGGDIVDTWSDCEAAMTALDNLTDINAEASPYSYATMITGCSLSRTENGKLYFNNGQCTPGASLNVTGACVPGFSAICKCTSMVDGANVGNLLGNIVTPGECVLPQDCVLSEWAEDAGCTVSPPATCGPGSQAYKRFITTPQAGSGKPCGDLQKSEDCEIPCPVDCVVSDWSTWSTCSTTCGDGSRTHTRTISTSPAHGGLACPADMSETQTCNLGVCLVCKGTEEQHGDTCVSPGLDASECALDETNKLVTAIYDAGNAACTYHCVYNASVASGVSVTANSDCKCDSGYERDNNFCKSMKGCTDPLNNNYDSSALEHDDSSCGSCKKDSILYNGDCECKGGYVQVADANGGAKCVKANPANNCAINDNTLTYAVYDNATCTYSCVANASAVSGPASATDSCQCSSGFTKSTDGRSCFEECDQEDHEIWSGNKVEKNTCRLTGCKESHKFRHRSCLLKGCQNSHSKYDYATKGMVGPDAAEWGADKDYCPDACEYKDKYGIMNHGCPWNTFCSNDGICTGCPSAPTDATPNCEAKQHWIDVALGSGNAVSLNVDTTSLWYDACQNSQSGPKASALDVDRCAASCLRGYGYQHTLGLWCPLDECRTKKSLDAGLAKEFYNCSKAFPANKMFVYHINGETTHFDQPSSTVSAVSVEDLKQDGAGESEALAAIASGEAVVRPESGIYHMSQKGCHQCTPHDLQDSSNPCHKAGQWNCQTTVELPAFEA